MSAEDFKARQRARELATCRHFTGTQNDACAVGVRYCDVRDRHVTGLGGYRYPCLGMDGAPSCPKRETKTEAEVDAEEAEISRRFALLAQARAAIVATKQTTGAVDCPLCKAVGALHFRRSTLNGHIHAACSTPNCLAWME